MMVFNFGNNGFKLISSLPHLVEVRY